jgi:hypothetical protein
LFNDHIRVLGSWRRHEKTLLDVGSATHQKVWGCVWIVVLNHREGGGIDRTANGNLLAVPVGPPNRRNDY